MKKKIIIELEIETNLDEKSLDSYLRRRIDNYLTGADLVQLDIYDSEDNS